MIIGSGEVVKEIRGEGMPVHGNPGKKGSLFVRLQVENPRLSFLTPDQLVVPFFSQFDFFFLFL